jgi:D-alanine-D-alanine ligase
MIVGLTYDLRSEWISQGFSEVETAEMDREDTVIAIETALHAEGFQTERIGNYKSLIAALNAGKRWDLVFNFCEGMYGLGREALVPALLDAYRIPYTFSDPVVLAVALHKGMTKRVVRDAGVPTPDFAIVESIDEVRSVHLGFPLFAKPLAEGTGKGISPESRITSVAELVTVCERLLSQYKQPVLVEEYLPGREFTTGIVGTGPDARVVGTMEVILLSNAELNAYTYENKEHFEDRVRYELPHGADEEGCARLALQAWRALGARDGGRIDIRMDAKGVPNFIEVNPLAGLHPQHSDLPIICSMVGVSYQKLIGDILKSALKRVRV